MSTLGKMGEALLAYFAGALIYGFYYNVLEWDQTVSIVAAVGVILFGKLQDLEED